MIQAHEPIVYLLIVAKDNVINYSFLYTIYKQVFCCVDIL